MSIASPESSQPRSPLAVVGIGCRFPGGVVDPSSFWDLLATGRSGIVEVPEDRWDRDRYYHPDRQVPGRMLTRWGGFLEHLDRFDPQFWGISPREAVRMDPQQRWLLEVAWEAMEDAGVPPSTLRGNRVGVFVGIAGNDYAGLQMPNHAGMDVHTNSGCTLSIASNRISYLLDLKGPSVSIDTACSSALVAMSQACQSIWDGQCDAVLTGGVNAIITPHATIGFSKASMLSPSGQCFAFDSRANGYVRGEGAGIVLVKRLEDALRDHNPVYCVIRAAVVNQDGHTSSMTVPGVEGQTAMLQEAYRRAGLDPGEVVYMEAHGTGTPVGDPIEATALGRVLQEGRPADQKCLIGSVKTNVGHLESGSGIAGFIKAALVLHHDTVPKNLNFESPNPNIPFEQLGLEVADRTQPLPHLQGKRPVAGVNSFGFGGTNAHVVLQAADPVDAADRRFPVERHSDPRPRQLRIPYDAPSGNGHQIKRERADRPYVLPISARDETALKDYALAFERLLADRSEEDSGRPESDGMELSDLCYSAGARKEQHDHRLVVIGSDRDQLRQRIANWLAGTADEGVIETRSAADSGDLVFVFTGQGAQWWKMGRELYVAEPVFRQTFDDISRRLELLAGWSLVEELIKTRDESQSKIDQTNIAQPAIFAVQVALAALWKSWGVTPARVIGHSVGEVAAAYVAGIYRLDDAIKIIYHRSRLQNQAGGDGRMVAAGISAAEARVAIGDRSDRVEVAVINSPSLVTLAGDREPLEQIAEQLQADGRFVRQLRINYAFHTHHMESIRDDLIECLSDIRPRRGRIPFVSTVTGSVLPGEKLDAVYWWRNVRQPVLFASGIANLVRAGERMFVELGPHPALESSIAEVLAEQNRTGDVFHSLKRKTAESTQMLVNLAGLHASGSSIDWQAVTQSRRRLVRLPKYPWQHESYWLEADKSRRERLDPIVHPMLGVRQTSQRPEWEFDLDPRRFRYLADHCIWDSLILPGAAYGEIGLAIAREIFPDDPYVVEELEILKALFISEDDVPTVRVSLELADRRYTIHHTTDGEHWELNARGKLVQLQAAETTPLDRDRIQERLPTSIGHQEYYDDFDAAGFQFRDNFRQIQRVWRTHGEALAEILVPEQIAESCSQYRIHPAVLDACFHVFRGVKMVDDPRENLFLPARVGRIRLYRDQPPTRLWAHGVMTDDDGQSMTTDIRVYDDQGKPVADILGFRVDKVDQTDGRADDDLYYQHRWSTSPLDIEPEEESTGTGRFLLFADQEGVTDSLAAKLRESGCSVTVVRQGDTYRQVDRQTFELSPSSSADMDRLIEELDSADPPFDGVVHAWSLDTPRASELVPETLAASQCPGVLSALRLTQLLEQSDWPTRLRFLTRDAVAVVDGDGATGLASASLIGFARVAYNEHASLRPTVIDLPRHASRAEPSAKEASDLRDELLADDEELEVAYREGNRYVNRLHPVDLDQLPGRLSAAKRGDDVVPYRLETRKPGILTHLSWNETRRRQPAEGEIEVQIHAGGINFRDVMKALAMYPGNPIDLLWFGDDFSGVVTAVGDGVDDLQIGDEVAGMAPYSFRAFSTIDRRMAFKKPARLSFEESATLPTVFLTSHYALDHLARIQPGERILIHAGTGGVGQAAIQIARHRGLEIFATAGTDEKRQMLQEMGVQHVMNSRTLEFADQVMEWTGGEGVDVVLNSLAGDFIPKSFSVLSSFGRFLEIGKVDVYGNSRIGLHALRNNISYFVIDLAQHLEKRTDFVGKLFRELLPRFEAGDYEPLTHTTFPVKDVIDAFRYMAQGKHVGKNVLRFDAEHLRVGPTADDLHRFRSEATYLIVGGAGGFGLELARWMSEHGARNMVLMSRSGPPDAEAETKIRQLRESGIRVLELRGDVTRLDDVRRVIDEAAEQLPPLSGVIHGAMVLEDRFIVDLDETSFRKVMDPKILGAWNLHLATRDLQLEHFICFSSFSNVIGGAKQSNYNAGNMFLDVLAHHRRAAGLPALTINWSALSGAGFVSRNEATAKYLDKLGMKSLGLDEAFAVMNQMLTKDPIQVAAGRADWQSFARLSPLVASSKTFRALVETTQRSDAGGSLRPRLLAATPEQRVELLLAFVTAQVADVFGVDVERVDPGVSLTNLGLDSLMAIDLINRIESEFGKSLPMGNLLRGPNLNELVEILLDLVEAPGEGTGEEDAAGPRTAGAMVPLAKSSWQSDAFPLTEGQQSLWFLYRLAPHSSAYNLTFAAKFTPHVDLPLMERAFAQVLARHPMLNVTFADADGIPVQRVRRDGEIDYREHDATELDRAELDEQLRRCASEPFDLEKGPVIRLDMFRLPEGHLGLMSMHHIVSDAWSVTILIRDLMEAYFSLRAGRSPQLPDQANNFADLVDWEQRHLESDAGKRMGDYWKQQVADAPKTIALPTDHPYPPAPSFRGGTRGFKLDADLSHRALQIAAEQNVTLFTLLLSAYELLLHRSSGQNDFLVGVPMAGRHHPGLHDTVGYFVNPVPLRSTTAGDPTFLEFLARNHQRVADGLVNQHYPLRHLVRDLDLPRDASRSPLFQVAFSMERIPGFDDDGIAVFLVGEGGHRFHLGDLEMESVDLNLRQAQFEILLVVEEAGGNIYGCWQYSRELFEPETIEWLNANFANLLEQLVADPLRPVSEYELAEGKSRIGGSDSIDPKPELLEKIAAWNATEVSPLDERKVHQRIERQVTRTPDRVAVQCGDQTLSYEELNRRANRLARHLRALGVTANERVGVCMERHVDLAVTLLAVMKSGGAYVPLDPTYPPERLRTIADSAGMSIVVTHLSHRPHLQGCGRLICLDTDAAEFERLADSNLQVEVGDEDLIYVIFTSGSTGHPKGAAVYHRGFTNLIDWFVREFELGENDASLVATSHGFDLTQKNLYALLTVGGTVRLSALPYFDADRVLAEMEEGGITRFNCTPSNFYLLVDDRDAEEIERLDSLRTVWLGGEPIDLKRLAAWWKRDGCNSDLVNTYGPTECTDICSFYRLAPGTEEPQLPVGFPIDNVKTYVLDEALRPVDIGTTGELCIAGAGVGAGYINDPRLTTQKFVPNPLATNDGAKWGGDELIYRTGDLASYRDDGAVEFVGRKDDQVKIRGYRIELGEIEHLLCQHLGVKEAVVIADQTESGTTRLVAYPVFKGDEVVAADLKSYLAEHIPSYMVPNQYVPLDSIPLNAHGKVDRRGLPRPDDESGARDAFGGTPPRDALEETLVELWQDVLGIRGIGVTDGFFDLGGDSMLSVQLMIKIRREIGVEIPLATLLQGDTVAELARYVRGKQDADWSPLVTIEPHGDRAPLFFIHPVGGNVLCYAELSAALDDQQPVYAIQARGLEGEEQPIDSMERMVDDYLAVIREVQPSGPYCLAAWSSGGVVAYEMARRLRAEGQEVGALALFDSFAPELLSFDANDEVAVIVELAHFLNQFYRLRIEVDAAELSKLDADDRIAWLHQKIQSSGFLPVELDPQAMRRFLDVCQANLRAIQAYRPESAELPTVLYRASDPTGRSQLVVEQTPADLGWGDLLGSSLQVIEVPGNHVTMLTGERARELGRRLGRQLAELVGGDSTTVISR